jgi:hypothetical protein
MFVKCEWLPVLFSYICCLYVHSLYDSTFIVCALKTFCYTALNVKFIVYVLCLALETCKVIVLNVCMQVALIAFLAHVGSFVPANSAKIGILQHIYTRIQTVESIATNISAFMIDLKQVSSAYGRCGCYLLSGKD